jgi:GTP cyclohydrolase I
MSQVAAPAEQDMDQVLPGSAVPDTFAPLRIVPATPPIDLLAAERAVRALLVALGQDPDAEHLLQTPRRVAGAYAELLTPRDFDLTTPKGVGVVVEAEHQCMSLRGVRAHGSRTLTSALHGHLRIDPAARQEFFALTRGR